MLKHVSQIFSTAPGYTGDQYKDPRWFEFSRSITAGHPSCHSCRREGLRLNVHHINYDRTRKLWEYEPSEVVVLCEPCHKLIGEVIRTLRRVASSSNAGNMAKIALLLQEQLRAKGETWVIERLAR